MKNIKKKFNIMQTDSGRFFTWVSNGCGSKRKKANSIIDDFWSKIIEDEK